MKKSVFGFLLAVGVTVSGCQNIQSAADSTVSSISKGVKAYDGWVSKGTARVWDEMRNKNIRDKFLALDNSSGNNVITLNKSLLNEKFKLEKRTFDTIYLEKYVLHAANFSEAGRKINQGAYISEKDLAAKLFVDQALAQGHEVRVYKASLNAQINDGLKQAINEFNGARNDYGFDPVFIEYDKMGSPVSIMTRSWQTISAIGVDSRIYTNIYFGVDTMRWFENTFGNKHLENVYLRTIK